jgi:hypothetical protein
MPTHDPDTNNKVERGPGYETTDANVKETAIFLVVLLSAVCVVFVLAFGIGKLINMELARQDGPPNKWSQLESGKPANLVSDPGIKQQQLQQVVKKFPTPRLETDDGAVDVAEMHAREDMLLNHYTWVDEQKQTVRIPITRAMQLLAQRGLPVEGEQPQGQSQNQDQQQAMFGDSSNVVTAPLTDGFARTGPELQMMAAKRQQVETEAPHTTQAELNGAH